MAKLTLINLLKLAGFSPANLKIKIVRHRHQPFDLEELLRRGQFDQYQWNQADHIFNCDVVISFMGTGRRDARLVGVYDITGHVQQSRQWAKDYLYAKTMPPGDHWYTATKRAGFEELENRLVIDWGNAQRAWWQWLKDKPVMEILPAGFSSPFPGYMDFILTYSQLKQIVDFPEANRMWHDKLSAVGGVYLITDDKAGKQYVGSATGTEGILGRWKAYAHDGHGGNVILKNLIGSKPDTKFDFRYTVLRTVSHSISSKEVLEMESLFKRKLGTRAEGLNIN